LNNINRLVELGRQIIPQDKTRGRARHVSFIVRKKKIFSIGLNNSYKSHPLSATYGHRFNSIHAELAAILNFPRPIYFLSQFTVVNIRYLRNGKIGCSKPCCSCEKMLNDFNVKRVVYLNKFGKWKTYEQKN
jgi:deoxycytidylate deaminase